jgi:hypothetical protein
MLQKIIAACLLLGTATVHGQTRAAFTDSSGDGLWSTPANWDLGVVPTSTNYAVVNSGRTATIASQASPIGGVVVGNGPTAGTWLVIEADLDTAYMQVAHNTTNAIGSVRQNGGSVSIAGAFNIATSKPGAQGDYTVAGGTLTFDAADLQLGTTGSGTFRVHGSKAASVHGSAVNGGSGATLEFALDARGVTPLVLSGNLAMNAQAKLAVDATDYAGFDGFFPLVQAGGTATLPAATNITVTPPAGRAAELVADSGSVWLRLSEQPGYSELLCSAIPPSRVAAQWQDSVFDVTRDFAPSTSAWSTAYPEEHVFGARLSSTTLAGTNSDPVRSWDLRVGRGGCIFSLRTPALGETVPPQNHSGDNAPWVDEVWQTVVVSTSLNNSSAGSPYFLHQAGTYLKDPVQTEPFNPPALASFADPTNRSFTVVSWPVHAHTGIYTNTNSTDNWRSYVILYTRYRDLGGGVIEATEGVFNYGPDTVNWFNMPWGGVRRTTTEHAFIAETTGGAGSNRVTNSFGDTVLNYNQTGGWMGHTADPSGNSPALALVYGKDASPLTPGQDQNSILKYGYAGGTSFQSGQTNWRNYFVTSCIRRYTPNRGAGLWSRFYLVLAGNLAEASAAIAQRNLVAAELQPFHFTAESSPLLGYDVTATPDGPAATRNAADPDFWLYAHPVGGSYPLFEVLRGDGRRFLTWNPYAVGTAAGDAYVVKPYDGSLAGLKLLGFAMPYSAVAPSQYTQISAIVADPAYLADGVDLAVRKRSRFQDWKEQAFGSTESSIAQNYSGDPDSDGLSNLQEYAVASDPLSPTPSIWAAAPAEQGGGMAFSFRRRPDAAARGLTYLLEQTTDLAGGWWTPVGREELTIEPVDESSELVTLQLTTHQAGFVRLRLRWEE